ncbi:MAG: hypothetical protein ACWGPS_05400 [Candidatus Promineifilaceae bacterium]
MKALVYWCRWHEAKLRLHGRDESAVWGELAFVEASQPFRFDLLANELTIGEGDELRVLRLDEMGVELEP